MTKKIGVILLSVVIALTTVASVVMILRFALDRGNGATSGGSPLAGGGGDKLFDSKKETFVKEEVIVSVRVLEEGLQNMGQLVTQEYYFTQAETYVKKETAGFLTSTAKVVYAYDGVVNAGVECDDIRVRRDDEEKVVYVTIPKAQVLGVIIDFDSFQELDSKQGIWSKIKLADINKSLQEFKNKAEANALEKGVLRKADENAELIMEKLVKSIMNREDYKIVFDHR